MFGLETEKMSDKTMGVTGREDNLIQVGTVDGSTITLRSPSDIRLDVRREQIASFDQRGADLVITLVDGSQIVIENFYVQGEGGLTSRLVINGEGAIDAAEISSGLLIAGALRLAGVGAALAGGSDGDAALADPAAAALAKIAAYADDQSAPAPTVDDYAAAGVTGVDCCGDRRRRRYHGGSAEYRRCCGHN